MDPYEIVKLNVGGTVFQTTNATVEKHPGALRSILDEKLPVKKNVFGYIFVDRDPTHFRIILNFMRDDDVALPDCKVTVEEILREAKYYSLDDLVELCKNKLDSMKDGEFRFFEKDSDYFNILADSKKPVAIIAFNSTQFLQIFSLPKPSVVKSLKSLIDRKKDKWEIYFARSLHSGLNFYNGEKSVNLEIPNIETSEDVELIEKEMDKFLG